MEYAIHAENVNKTYAATKTAPAKVALKDVSLHVPQGGIYGLLGPNGAGKSTFINILAGLVVKTSGKVCVWGFDIDENPRQSKVSIGVVPQEINADVFFTPREALEMQAGLFGVPKEERITSKLLDVLGLRDKENAYVRALSGGMKRRLLVAKAMVHRPPILVLDEPTAGVDIELRRQLWDYVLSLNAGGVTIVLTTHYLEEAQSLCSDIAIIDGGQLRIEAPKTELLSRLDKKLLILRPETPIESLPELPFSASLREDGCIALTYSPRRDAVHDILGALQAHGVKPRDVTTQQPDLEEIFMAMTYGRKDDTGTQG